MKSEKFKKCDNKKNLLISPSESDQSLLSEESVLFFKKKSKKRLSSKVKKDSYATKNVLGRGSTVPQKITENDEESLIGPVEVLDENKSDRSYNSFSDLTTMKRQSDKSIPKVQSNTRMLNSDDSIFNAESSRIEENEVKSKSREFDSEERDTHLKSTESDHKKRKRKRKNSPTSTNSGELIYTCRMVCIPFPDTSGKEILPKNYCSPSNTCGGKNCGRCPKHCPVFLKPKIQQQTSEISGRPRTPHRVTKVGISRNLITADDCEYEEIKILRRIEKKAQDSPKNQRHKACFDPETQPTQMQKIPKYIISVQNKKMTPEFKQLIAKQQSKAKKKVVKSQLPKVLCGCDFDKGVEKKVGSSSEPADKNNNLKPCCKSGGKVTNKDFSYCYCTDKKIGPNKNKG